MNTIVIVDQGIIDGERIVAVSYLEPTADWDSGFACFSVPPNKVADTDTAVMHLDCFINDHPEAGQGMDIAREHGEAIRDNYGWAARACATSQPVRRPR